MIVPTVVDGTNAPASWGNAVAAACNRLGGKWSRIATQSIPNATLTTITWDTEVSDFGMNVTVPTTTITLPDEGIWAIGVRSSYNTTNPLGPNNFLRLVLGGSNYDFPGVSTVSKVQIGAHTIELPAGTTIRVDLYQDSGATLNADCSINIWRAAI
jgi:hypothetical protein